MSQFNEEIRQHFELLKTITRANGGQATNMHVSKIEKFIYEQLPADVARLAPPNFPELYFDFKAEFDKLKDFILYEPLIGKQVVALGGGFSSGKSTFLNTLLGTKVLPAKIDPSTSVPTYIVQSATTAVQGINVFDAKMDLTLTDLKSIAHGFGRIEDDNDEQIADEVTLGHILKNLFVQIPEQTFSNIAFLDTPGYSKPDEAGYSVKTDEKIARAQLNTADFILWFVPADFGTISEEDIKFMKTLYAEIPLCIIVNKADKKADEELAEVIDKIKKVLDLKGVRYTDVLAFSRSSKKDYDKQKIIAHLQKWNAKQQEATFAYNFKKLFVACREYYEEQILEENRRLNRLNKALTLGTDDVQDYLLSLVSEIKYRLQLLKDAQQKLKKLQDEFFTQLKAVADQAGIAMPEPEEIELLQEKIQDVKSLITIYKERLIMNNSYDVESRIKDFFVDLDVKFYEQKGQGQYNRVLKKLVTENFQIN